MLLRFARFLKLFSLAVASLLFIGLSYQLATEHTHFTSSISNLLFRNNFHEIVPGELYRSAKMAPGELNEYVNSYGIKTVVDLRLSADEGNDEQAESKHPMPAINTVRFPLRSTRVPSPTDLKHVVSMFDTLERPILVHCDSGTHRSGVFSALYLLDQKALPIEKALEQLSLRFGFVAWERDLKTWSQGHPTIDHLLWTLAADHEGKHLGFRDWLAHRYPDFWSKLKKPGTEDVASRDTL